MSEVESGPITQDYEKLLNRIRSPDNASQPSLHTRDARQGEHAMNALPSLKQLQDFPRSSLPMVARVFAFSESSALLFVLDLAFWKDLPRFDPRWRYVLDEIFRLAT
jgi:hypothetical protein